MNHHFSISAKHKHVKSAMVFLHYEGSFLTFSTARVSVELNVGKFPKTSCSAWLLRQSKLVKDRHTYSIPVHFTLKRVFRRKRSINDTVFFLSAAGLVYLFLCPFWDTAVSFPYGWNNLLMFRGNSGKIASTKRHIHRHKYFLRPPPPKVAKNQRTRQRKRFYPKVFFLN